MDHIHIFWYQTNTFQNTNLKIAYKTANRLHHHLKSKGTPRDIYSHNAIYQLQCGECALKYVGQTGRPFRVRYREHRKAVRANKYDDTKCAQHILETRYIYNTTDAPPSVALVRKRTTPTERMLLVGEVSGNFCG
jgi:hypothetical protein